MQTYTIQASYPLDAYRIFEVEADSPEAALALAKEQLDEDPDFWSDQEFDFDTSGDVSFRVELDADVNELEELGDCHRLSHAAPKLLEQLKALVVQIEASGGLIVPPGVREAIAEAEGTP